MPSDFISIIIPTKNRQDILLESVHYALQSIQDLNAEIIVINDGDAIHNLPQNGSLRLFENHQQGVSKARNLGAKEAKGNILFFIDDDMWITKKSLQNIFLFAEQGLLTESCLTLNWEYPQVLQEKIKTEKIGRYILQSNYHTLEGRLHQKVDYSKPTMVVDSIGSCSFCISKELFNKVGGYNEGITFQGEDIDLSNRLNKNGITILLTTEITCYHNHSDRLTIDGHLDRTYRGYQSQAKAGIIDLSPKKIAFFSALLPFFGLFKLIFRCIPNSSLFDIITFRLTGILSSLTYVKAIREAGR